LILFEKVFDFELLTELRICAVPKQQTQKTNAFSRLFLGWLRLKQKSLNVLRQVNFQQV
jgi:hypothetical protein